MAKVTSRWHHARKPQPGEITCKHNLLPKAEHGKGRQWQCRWIDEAGKQQSRNFDKKGDADALQITLQADKQRGVYRDLDAGKQTFEAYAREWLRLRTGLERATRNRYTSYLENHVYGEDNPLGSVRLRNVKPFTINNWAAGLPLADNTKRAILGLVSTILDAAIDNDVIDRNPCKAGSVERPGLHHPEIEVWSPERVQGVRAAMPPRWQVTVDLLAGLGIRQAELLGLSPADVDFLRGHVDIVRQLKREQGTFVLRPPKGGKPRRLPLRPVVRNALAAHLAAYPAQTVTLPWGDPEDGRARTVALALTDRRGKPLYQGAFNESVWWRATAAVGIEREPRRNGCHVLRHTFASVLLANGVSLPEVKDYLGHSDISITAKTYSHVIPRNADQVVWRGLAAIDDLLIGTELEGAADEARA